MDGQGTTWRRSIAENFNRLSRVHQRYRRQTDRQTDGPSMTNSEHELEFTFAKKYTAECLCMPKPKGENIISPQSSLTMSIYLKTDSDSDSRSRSLYVVVCPSVVCLSVCL